MPVRCRCDALFLEVVPRARLDSVNECLAIMERYGTRKMKRTYVIMKLRGGCLFMMKFVRVSLVASRCAF